MVEVLMFLGNEIFFTVQRYSNNEVRSQKSEVRSQKSEVRSQKSEQLLGAQKPVKCCALNSICF